MWIGTTCLGRFGRITSWPRKSISGHLSCRHVCFCAKESTCIVRLLCWKDERLGCSSMIEHEAMGSSPAPEQIRKGKRIRNNPSFYQLH
jgi:hypothetical protein